MFTFLRLNVFICAAEATSAIRNRIYVVYLCMSFGDCIRNFDHVCFERKRGHGNRAVVCLRRCLLS